MEKRRNFVRNKLIFHWELMMTEAFVFHRFDCFSRSTLNHRLHWPTNNQIDMKISSNLLFCSPTCLAVIQLNFDRRSDEKSQELEFETKKNKIRTNFVDTSDEFRRRRKPKRLNRIWKNHWLDVLRLGIQDRISRRGKCLVVEFLKRGFGWRRRRRRRCGRIRADTIHSRRWTRLICFCRWIKEIMVLSWRWNNQGRRLNNSFRRLIEIVLIRLNRNQSRVRRHWNRTSIDRTSDRRIGMINRFLLIVDRWEEWFFRYFFVDRMFTWNLNAQRWKEESKESVKG